MKFSVTNELITKYPNITLALGFVHNIKVFGPNAFSQGYRDSSKITLKTNNVFFVIDAPEGIDKQQVEKYIKELLVKFNSDKYFVLDENNKSVEI